jgi:hypothetical protein
LCRTFFEAKARYLFDAPRAASDQNELEHETASGGRLRQDPDQVPAVCGFIRIAMAWRGLAGRLKNCDIVSD